MDNFPEVYSNPNLPSDQKAGFKAGYSVHAFNKQ
jgi:hypothetical protein